jgi:hypothetical protein
LIRVSAVIVIVLASTWIVGSAGADDVASSQHSLMVQGDLQAAIDLASPGDTLLIPAGVYEAIPTMYDEAICGNCVELLTPVRASIGFRITGKPLVLVGEDRESTVLITNAGYGVFFDWSWGSRITNLTITGGVRDPDGNATDAAIVVKHSRVIVENVLIRDNTSRIDTVVVGIGGVFGREGSEVFILNNDFRRNGWDGVALYRGASAVIADNTIEGGRGAGIGITWDASAMVFRNRISGYWKGIGAFGDSWASVRNNVVFDNLGWGIVATGKAYMEVANNVIHHNGNCGFAVWEPTAKGVLKNNIITANGWREEWVCPGVGIWMNAHPDDFPVLFNDVWGNASGQYEGIPDQTGINGNISDDPMLSVDGSFALGLGSPCIDTGDSAAADTDGSRCDIGIYGGPQGRPPHMAR